MQERSETESNPRPVDPAGPAGPSLPAVSDAVRVQILATEHWSLLATRQLAWTEAFSRAGISLTVLSSTTPCPYARRPQRPGPLSAVTANSL